MIQSKNLCNDLYNPHQFAIPGQFQGRNRWRDLMGNPHLNCSVMCLLYAWINSALNVITFCGDRRHCSEREIATKVRNIFVVRWVFFHFVNLKWQSWRKGPIWVCVTVSVFSVFTFVHLEQSRTLEEPLHFHDKSRKRPESGQTPHELMPY